MGYDYDIKLLQPKDTDMKKFLLATALTTGLVLSAAPAQACSWSKPSAVKVHKKHTKNAKKASSRRVVICPRYPVNQGSCYTL